jgi:L-lactate dehydrogenase complex protein LldG
MDLERNIAARETILGSIREHLAASRSHDAIHAEDSQESVPQLQVTIPPANGSTVSLIAMFKERLEAVGGHCIVAHDEKDVVTAVAGIISELQRTPLRARRVAISNAPQLEGLLRQTAVDMEEIATSPDAGKLFDYDIGVSSAQAAIAETGTLVLDSESERHRLVSLVPPVHIAIVESGKICQTLGEALTTVQGTDAREVSPTITFITGPSRTADIELTLAIGVHGPQELFVIVKAGGKGGRSED